MNGRRVKIVVKTIRFDQLDDDLKKRKSKVLEAFSNALFDVGDQVVLDTQETLRSDGGMPAYDTGNLHNSITHIDTEKFEQEVHAEADHAFFVHRGTNRMSPRPFFVYVGAVYKKMHSKLIRKVIEKEGRT